MTFVHGSGFTVHGSRLAVRRTGAGFTLVELMVVMMVIMMLMVPHLVGMTTRAVDDAETCRTDAGALRRAGCDLHTLECQTPECSSELFHRETGVNQRAENHIARGARETVEVDNVGHVLLFRFRAPL